MKKLPLVFCCVFLACSSKKEIVYNSSVFNDHPQPYHVSTVGKWNKDYVIYTLIDARDIYFTVKEPAARNLKKGDVYTPYSSAVH